MIHIAQKKTQRRWVTTVAVAAVVLSAPSPPAWSELLGRNPEHRGHADIAEGREVRIRYRSRSDHIYPGQSTSVRARRRILGANRSGRTSTGQENSSGPMQYRNSPFSSRRGATGTGLRAIRYSTRTTMKNGVASWYGRKFHGRRTANGEIYNMYAHTTAHRRLPFGTLVRVTNLRNGRQAVVRINDRGPFVRGRDIDLSYRAACDLDMVETGVESVRMEILSG